MKIKLLLISASLGIPLSGISQNEGIRDFLSQVKEKNLSYLSEKYQIDIAQARAKAARIFPDPSLSFGYSDNQDKKMQMGKTYEIELGYTLELGGKRGARIALAKSETELSKALVEDYFSRLRAEASIAYFNLAKEQKVLQLQRRAFRQICEIASNDSIRLAAGDLNETDAKLSRMEKIRNQIELWQKETECNNLLADLEIYQGGKLRSAVDDPEQYLKYTLKAYRLDELLQQAHTNRVDLKVALQNRNVSAKNLALAKASRAMDLDLSIGIAHNTLVRNETAPAPSVNTFSAGIGIPLQFSRINRGELKAASLELQQQELAYEACLKQSDKETTQAYLSFESAKKQLLHFQQGILKDSEDVLAKKTYAYKRGETTWLDWINAQNEHSNHLEAYYQSIYQFMESWMNLQLATGSWEVL